MKQDFPLIDAFYKKQLSDYSKKGGKKVKKRIFFLLFLFNFKWLLGMSLLAFVAGGFIIFYSNYEVASGNSGTYTEKVKTEVVFPIASNALKDYEVVTSNQATIQLVSEPNTEQRQESIASAVDSPAHFKIVKQSTASTPTKPFDVSVNEIEEHETEQLFLHTLSRRGFSGLSLDEGAVLNENEHPFKVKTPGNGIPWASINLYGGPAFSRVQVSGADAGYLDLRATYESNKPGWSMGIDFKFHLDNWVITTGMSYAVYNQKRNYSYSYQEYLPDDSYYQYDSTWIWVHETPNTVIPVLMGVDSTWNEVYAERKVENKGTNQLKYVEIPLTVGYLFQANLFWAEINGGVSVGILNYSEMVVPSLLAAHQFVETKQINRTSFNILVNATFYYRLNTKWSLMASPYYKQSLQSLFNSTYPVTQRYGTMGLNVGLNISF